jgi:hypothetical protein
MQTYNVKEKRNKINSEESIQKFYDSPAISIFTDT